MTDTSKPVTRVSVTPHSRHQRKIILTVGPGDCVGVRLQRARAEETAYISLESLFNVVELRRAAGDFNTAPCKNPKSTRNV